MRSFVVIVFLILAAGFINGCSSSPTKKHTHHAPMLPGMTAPPAKAEPKPTAAPELIEEEVLGFEEEANEGESLDSDTQEDDGVANDLEAPAPRRKHGVPFEFNQSVAWWIEYFSQHDRERFQRFLDRGEPYREAVENILEENKVPVDLYYLGLIESGFNNQAKSRVKAVGVWQFMRATGKDYGLGIDSYIDERIDPIRATEASARYLRDLYREFKSWYLAMAAYNAGPGRIRGAVRRGRTNNFWELVSRKVLPKETMEYVPKFMAARYIGENPDVFGFYINEEKKYPNVELIKVPSPVSFDSIERVSGIPAGTLSFVNPHYLKEYTHPGRKIDEIWVPTAHAKTVEANYSKLLAHRVKLKPARVAVRSRSSGKVPVYIVRKGDTLYSIAKKRGLSVSYLKEANQLHSLKVVPGQTIRLAATSYKQKKTHPRTHKKRKLR